MDYGQKGRVSWLVGRWNGEEEEEEGPPGKVGGCLGEWEVHGTRLRSPKGRRKIPTRDEALKKEKNKKKIKPYR